MCTASGEIVGWLVNFVGPYNPTALRNGILAGYSADLDSNNLIVQNIMINDVRNGSAYRCEVMVNMNIILSNAAILYVAGEYHTVANVY